MTKLGRVRRVCTGIIVIVYAVILLTEDPDIGMQIVAAIMSLTFTLRGVQTLIYYFTMARSMVGGKFSLLRGLLLLDLGAFTSSLTYGQTIYVVLYVAVIHLFAGVVDFFRASETRKMRSPGWRTRILFGVTNVFLALVLIAGGFVMHSLLTVIYIYAGGLIYAGIVRIVTAFRRTSIVYIQ